MDWQVLLFALLLLVASYWPNRATRSTVSRSAA